jgi:membrane-bound metal-dependent hydrolase YbcI (DUF457 family)
MPGGGLGCLLGLLISGVLIYFTIKGLYYALGWAAPALIVLSLIINWRAVADTGSWFLKSLQKSPIATVLIGAICVVAFPFFALYLFLKALGYNKMQQLRRQFEENNGADSPLFGFGNPKVIEKEPEYTDYEEIESKPKQQ